MTLAKVIDVGALVQLNHSITIGGKTYPVGSQGTVRRQDLGWCQVEMVDGNKVMIPKEDLRVCEEIKL